MKTQPSPIKVIHTVTEYTRFYGMPPPSHPLLTLIDTAQMRHLPINTTPILQQIYTIALKKNVRGKVKYGLKSYDFSEGMMSFIAPGQVFGADPSLDISELSGWMLLFHPDLINGYPLGKKMASYSFFSYDVHEALHLSAKEETVIDSLLAAIQIETEQAIDRFSQDVLVAQLEVLLGYANRFYNRQFVTRRAGQSDLLTRFESALADYFASDEVRPIPSVQYFADALSVSPAYLSDMLRALTGQNTQQHIHHALIEKAKNILLTTSLSISEAAFQLGFEYPQYFSRLFKSKTGMTPAAFRLSVN